MSSDVPGISPSLPGAPLPVLMTCRASASGMGVVVVGFGVFVSKCPGRLLLVARGCLLHRADRNGTVVPPYLRVRRHAGRFAQTRLMPVTRAQQGSAGAHQFCTDTMRFASCS